MAQPPQDTVTRRSLLLTGVLLGIGIVGTLDEVIFHQLLQWHNFYVHATQRWRLISDGLFHIFSSALLVISAIRLWRDRHRQPIPNEGRTLAAGILLGGGGFNLYDGTIQHKLLNLHPIREGVTNILPYDLLWNGAALLIVLAGWLIWRTIQPRAES